MIGILLENIKANYKVLRNYVNVVYRLLEVNMYHNPMLRVLGKSEMEFVEHIYDTFDKRLIEKTLNY